MGIEERDPLAQLSLPPGFRFYPTDEELLVQYLRRKVAGDHFPLQIIGEIDLYKFNPWILPSKATFGEREWYFFSPRDRKYPNGSRPNRVAGSGYWKATGTDKVITIEGRKVGIKKSLVFYVGKAPKGTKTNWIMHEYRLFDASRKDGSSKLDDWVLCRIYNRNSTAGKSGSSFPRRDHGAGEGSEPSCSHLNDVLEQLPEIGDSLGAPPSTSSLKAGQEEDGMALQSLLSSDTFSWSALAGSNPVPEFGSSGSTLQEYKTRRMSQLQVSNNVDDVYAPSLPPLSYGQSPADKCVNSVEEEVQSRLSTQRANSNNISSGFFDQTRNFPTQNQINSADPFVNLYPNPTAVFGFRR
ncbi:hypothetical protein Nepgr_016231 [Nepenthes gracilis]|uniref:NAC domain-containing protein n=1 Tax=Nepenthes gracilis TaxID=150966 RepID=A0AAD3SMB9_NEPGR|nr:hypothetical protein Nepgr_016231 [Nepenthes gracilis]